MINWNKTALLLACTLPLTAWAQQRTPVPAAPVAGAPAAAPAATPATMPAPIASDPLIDALTCRSNLIELPGLLGTLRRQRPNDFVQTDRQYSAPAMDLYRLEDPVHAWGQSSDAIVITTNRVLMVVPGPVETATQRLEESLAATASAPLPVALDDQHALVLYEEERPGLQNRVLIGCEYRLPELSLLDDPTDAWRKPAPLPASSGIPASASATSAKP